MSQPESDVVGPADQIADERAESATLVAAARTLVAAHDRGEEVSDEALQAILAPLIKLYAVRFQAGDRFWPFGSRRGMPATAVMILCNAMLRAINSETFELAIWQAFSGDVAPPQSEDL
jgi:hypothetical protein